MFEETSQTLDNPFAYTFLESETFIVPFYSFLCLIVLDQSHYYIEIIKHYR